MLDRFRKRDDSRSPNALPESHYGQLHQALSTAAAAETVKREVPKSEVPKSEAPQTQGPAKPSQPGDNAVCKLIVGPDIKLKGAEITDCDTLVVEGRVEASMDSRVIQIAEKGVFVGKAGIDVAEIRGRFEGELTAHSQLVIHSTGRVSGTIRYGKIAIEEGGELSGDVAAIGSTKPAATGSASDQNRKPATGATATPSSHAIMGDGRSASSDKSTSAARSG